MKATDRALRLLVEMRTEEPMQIEPMQIEPMLRALVTLQRTSWVGERDGYSIVTSAQFWTAKGKILTPETLGGNRSGYAGVEFKFFEVLVERIVQDRVGFAYSILAIANPGGGLNLSGEREGRFILRDGESVKLGTPVFDAGASLTLSLDQISQRPEGRTEQCYV